MSARSDENEEDWLISRIIEGYSRDMNREHSTGLLNKQAQISSLVSQINPHFLYNTLESIRGQALDSGEKDIARITEALALYFRFTIRKNTIVMLREELDNIRNYFQIQKYRFRNRFDLKIRMEDTRCSSYLIPKLTLQPIVENSIYHGLELKETSGIVSIDIEISAKRMTIIVSDDGLGLSEEKLLSLQRRLKFWDEKDSPHIGSDQAGIALPNVNKRIKLLFGDIYGLQIYSIEGKGTDVEITLPLIRSQQELSEIQANERRDTPNH